MPGIESVKSTAEWFFMPTLSYVVKDGRWAYGIGGFSQGGMGADYGNDTFLSVDPNSGIQTGLPDESAAMIGRLIIPVAFEASERLTIGASIDLVYGRLTMKQLMPRQALEDMMTPGAQTLGVASADPSTAAGIGSANYAHFDLDKLDNWGCGGQVGLTFQGTETLTLGASYQFETQLGDLEADASIKAGVGNMYQSIPGRAKVEDFQWPATWKLGVAFRATDRLLLVADIKRYNWSEVLDALRIRFRPDAGGFVDVDMYQEWYDRTVYSIGAEYTLNPRVKLHAGFNYGADPVPEDYLQHLGEAITQDHLMLGVGMKVGNSGQIDLAYAHTCENTGTNNNPLVGLTSSMSQDSFNSNCRYKF